MKMIDVFRLLERLVEESESSVSKERRAADWLGGSSSCIGIGVGFVAESESEPMIPLILRDFSFFRLLAKALVNFEFVQGNRRTLLE